ncbi:MAG: hypothetical protein ACK47B_10820 [Armatimonadota bacterium]
MSEKSLADTIIGQLLEALGDLHPTDPANADTYCVSREDLEKTLRPLLEGRGSEIVLPEKLTPAIQDALGLPNFRTGPIAHLFRAAGHDIPCRFEEEQAFVLFWALELALKHGEAWRAWAGDELNALRASLPKEPDGA